MNGISELNERADTLARQIGLIQTEFHTGDVDTKIHDIGNVIKELRYDNDRLARGNEGLKVSLASLISAVEDSLFSDLSDTFQGVRDKMNAILETGRINDASAEATTTAGLAVVACRRAQGRPSPSLGREGARQMNIPSAKPMFDDHVMRHTVKPRS